MGNIQSLSGIPAFKGIQKVLEKKPSEAPAGPAPQAPADQAPKAPKDGVKTLIMKQGSADAKFSFHNPEQEIAAWKKAGEQGTPIAIAGESKLQVLGGLLTELKASGASAQELKQVQQFMKELDKTGVLENFAEMLQSKGITREQLDLITKGDFSAEAAEALIKSPVIF